MIKRTTAVVREWSKDGIRFCIAKAGLGHYCGYCTFPHRPVREHGYNGFMEYVPVHGHITYAAVEQTGTTYGFDCAHAGDDEDPNCQDEQWVKVECERMAEAIKLAVVYEPAYLEAGTNEEKAAIIDAYHEQLREHGIEFCLTDNFGALINVLGGYL